MSTVVGTEGGGTQRSTISRMVGFGSLSALGLGLDCLLFAALMAVDTPPLLANMVSAGTAVSLVFVLSARRVFGYRSGSLRGRYLAYVVYQVLAVTAASIPVAQLCATSHLPPVVCKLLVLPLTFLANFLVLRWLTRRADGRP